MRKRTQISETASEIIRQGILNRPPLKAGIMLAFWAGIILLCWIAGSTILLMLLSLSIYLLWRKKKRKENKA